ncbi:unnamed protein product [Phytophthora fragariaefolia]|uniref:Unnamed protein product n=1 Tax=Phytophthora fragariaefolia TaxID=1490495 RepID=A0A9W6XTM4_9STRA|nr:unnamed protein product [Phytophthora fragariaefolia]
MDTNGPMKTMGVYGRIGTIKYFLSINDDNTSWRWTYVLRNKQEVYEKVESLLLRLEREGKFTNRRIRSDGGTEFVISTFKTFCKKKGIDFKHQTHIARKRTEPLSGTIRAKSIESDVPLRMLIWHTDGGRRHLYAVRETAQCTRATCLALGVFAHVPAVMRKDKKLSARAVKCRFLGISDEPKGYRLWDIYNNKHILSRDVLFYHGQAGIRRHDAADTIESAARESPAAERVEANTPATERTGAVGANTSATPSTVAVGAEVPHLEITGAVGAKLKRRRGLIGNTQPGATATS